MNTHFKYFYAELEEIMPINHLNYHFIWNNITIL